MPIATIGPEFADLYTERHHLDIIDPVRAQLCSAPVFTDRIDGVEATIEHPGISVARTPNGPAHGTGQES